MGSVGNLGNDAKNAVTAYTSYAFGPIGTAISTLGLGPPGDDPNNIKHASVSENLKKTILKADLSDADRQAFLDQLSSLGALSPNEGNFSPAVKSLLEAVATKDQRSADVAKQYKESIGRASKNQSTIITQGQPAAVSASGGATSLITSGGAR